jgi:NTP pyrophosphatase (non-canonical NTP hydrolase)
MNVLDLAAILDQAARDGVRNIRDEFVDRYAGDHLPDAVAMTVAEEAGEFIKEFRRWRGYARRPGAKSSMELELADVVISAWFAAEVLDVDLAARIREKLSEVFARGWRDPR